MADPLKQPFTTQAPISAVFDFTDFESAVGYVSYQGYNSDNDGTPDYHINKNEFHSDTPDTVSTTTSGTSPTYAKTMDLDFDTNIFNLPRTINGTAIINMTLAIKHAAAVRYRGVAIISVYDGSTETVLGTATSKSVLAVGTSAWESENFTVNISLTKRAIKKGELLRLTIQHWSHTGTGESSVETAIGHSPFGLTDNIDPATQDSDYNQTILNAPFDIQ